MWEEKKKLIQSDYFLLLTKKLQLNTDQIINPLNVHYHGFQYIHIYKDYFISNYSNNAGIVEKMKIFNNTNRDFRVIKLLI